MTDTPGTPSTEAGRALLENEQLTNPYGQFYEAMLAAVLAIEAEAHEQGREDGMTLIRHARDEAYAEAALRAAAERDADVERLREALEVIADADDRFPDTTAIAVRRRDIARMALRLISASPAPAAPEIDVERLAKAIEASDLPIAHPDGADPSENWVAEHWAHWSMDAARQIAAEYARLRDT